MAGEFAFGRGRVRLPEQLHDREAQDTIADELEALVVFGNLLCAAEAGMRQRSAQHRFILEAVAELLFELFVFARFEHHAGIRKLARRAVGSANKIEKSGPADVERPRPWR
jgi:hypothetical protein